VTVFRSDGDLASPIGGALLALLTITVLVTWAPSLGAGLGDNHEGRILGRHALHVQNAQADGLAASGWLSDWSPYVGRPEGDQTSYSHHPPLLNLGYYLTAQVLPVRVDTAMRVFAYLLGVAALPVGAGILRRLGFAWVPVLVATTAVAVTPLFWAYGRLSGNVTLLLAMTLAVVRVAEPRSIPARELAVASTVPLAAVIAGYLGLATAALLGLWLLARRGLDRVTLSVGIAMAVGAAITLAYVVGNTGGSEIGAQLEMRTQGGDFTAGEFLARIATWSRELLPVWWRWLLLPAALVAGLVDRRTRPLTAITATVAAAYVLGLPNGSFIHDYWIFPVLLPVWFGIAVLVSWLLLGRPDAGRTERMITPSRTALGLAVGVLIAGVGAAGALAADVPSRYVLAPQAAGDLARATEPAPGQQRAWRTAGMAAPRWLSLYWDLPPALVGRAEVIEVPDADLVLVRLDTLPGWLGDRAQVRDAATRLEGDYAVLTGRALKTLAAAG
jgi:hypothetical protein